MNIKNAGLVTLGAAVWGVVACAPALNWRAVPFDGLPVDVMLPCKPERASRDIDLPDAVKTTLRMASCEAKGQVFAVSTFEWTGEAETQAQQWMLGNWQRLGTSSPSDDPDARPSGWVRDAWALKDASYAVVWRGTGRNHQGQPIEARIALTHRDGLWLQLALYAPKIDETSWQGLVESAAWKK